MSDRFTEPALSQPGLPYWREDAALADVPETEAPERADIVIVGAGYTGLTAAITAAQKGASVLVLEAGQPGDGASSRNGGMLGAHPRFGLNVLVKRYGEEVARGVTAESPAAFDYVCRLIADHGIDCDFQQTGRIQMAWRRKHFTAQKQLVAALAQSSSLQAQIVEREELGAHVNTPLYHGGIFYPTHAALHPGKFVNGLVRRALELGVKILPRAEVRDFHAGGVSFERNGRTPGVRAPRFKHTSRAQHVSAGKVLIATNGYSAFSRHRAFDWFTARVFALPSYIIATEPLAPELIDRIAPGRRMMVETRAKHSYYRLSPDGTRLLFGGRAAMVPVDLQTAARRLHHTMCEVWPQLAHVKVSHVWTGNTGYAFDAMPHVGVREGVHFAMGYSGSGVAMAPYLGEKMALQALGDPAGETAFSHTSLRRSWLHPARDPWFLQAANLWYRTAVDWFDRP